MCGIAGIVTKEAIHNRDIAHRMQTALRHRGPDGSGEFYTSHVSLVHTRLSIIDLAGGAQPLYSEDGNLVLIANGEIYNYVELRDALIADGFRFRTHSDCEPILALYKKYGDDCVKYLRGMFAFALWDKREGKLLLARDRMGEKPLYLAQTPHGLVFASELRALLSSGIVNSQLNPTAVMRYFHHQYVPEPDTLFNDITKLPAGYYMTVEVDPWRIETHQYWSMLSAEPLSDDPAVAIRERLDESVRLVLRSDVPIGLALSGGLDSSTIACLAAKHYPGRLKAITVGYAGSAGFDERGMARELADQLGIDHISVEIDDERMLADFGELCEIRDDPIGDISGYGYYSVMKCAHEQGLKVMLQGHGIDELLWGYPWVRKAVSINEEQQNSDKRLHIANISRSGILGRLGFKKGIPITPGRVIFCELTPFNQCVHAQSNWIFSDKFLRSIDKTSLYKNTEWDQIHERMDLEITRMICDTYLVENGVAQGDRLSMANSVEVRLPYLDYRLIETIIGLRKHSRDDQLPPKARFLDAIRDIVPPDILNRPKRGFSPPVIRWQQRLRETYGEKLRNGYLVQQGILTPESAKRLSESSMDTQDLAVVSRIALVLELWCQRVAGSISFGQSQSRVAGGM